MPRIELPDDQWADVRDDLDKAPRKFTKAIGAVQAEMASLPSFAEVRNAAREAGETDIAAAAANLSQHMSTEDIPLMMPMLERLKEAKVLALVTAWSFDLPLEAGSLDELPADAFEALAAEAEKRTAAAVNSKAALLDPTRASAASND